MSSAPRGAARAEHTHSLTREDTLTQPQGGRRRKRTSRGTTLELKA